mmetsp:Transcript_38011/g.108533  ORF Transcript_38011/g.108533 Transcript_38011/m.108533 type:complete len:358 (+) Transcript_38011:1028-2101(+)
MSAWMAKDPLPASREGQSSYTRLCCRAWSKTRRQAPSSSTRSAEGTTAASAVCSSMDATSDCSRCSNPRSSALRFASRRTSSLPRCPSAAATPSLLVASMCHVATVSSPHATITRPADTHMRVASRGKLVWPKGWCISCVRGSMTYARATGTALPEEAGSSEMPHTSRQPWWSGCLSAHIRGFVRAVSTSVAHVLSAVPHLCMTVAGASRRHPQVTSDPDPVHSIPCMGNGAARHLTGARGERMSRTWIMLNEACASRWNSSGHHLSVVACCGMVPADMMGRFPSTTVGEHTDASTPSSRHRAGRLTSQMQMAPSAGLLPHSSAGTRGHHSQLGWLGVPGWMTFLAAEPLNVGSLPP